MKITTTHTLTFTVFTTSLAVKDAAFAFIRLVADEHKCSHTLWATTPTLYDNGTTQYGIGVSIKSVDEETLTRLGDHLHRALDLLGTVLCDTDESDVDAPSTAD